MSRIAVGLLLAALPILSLLPAPADPPAPVKQAPRVDRLGDPLPEGALARLGTRRLRHVGFPWALAFSPNGKVLASGGEDQTLCLWDAATGKELHRLTGHGYAVCDVAFSADGKRVASSSGIQRTIRVWDTATGKELHRWRTELDVYLLAFAPGGRLVSSEADGAIRFWDPATGKQVGFLRGHREGVSSIAFVRGDKTVVTSGRHDRAIVHRELATGRELGRFEGNGGPAAVSPNGKLVAAQRGPVRVWELATGKQIQTIPAGDRVATFLAFLPDNRTLVVATENWILHVLDVATGKSLRTITAPTIGVHDSALSPDGRVVAAVTHSGTVQMWEVATGKELCPLEGHRGPVAGVGYSPDGKLVITRGPSRDIRLWDPATGREVGVLEGHTDYIKAMAISPDGKLVASAAGSQDRTVRLWDVAARKEVRRLQVVGWIGAPAAKALAFSPDGARLASGADDVAIRLWDVATGTLLRRIEGGQADALAYAPDGRTLAMAVRFGKVVLWDAYSGQQVKALAGPPGVTALAFAPDGKTLATAGEWKWSEERGDNPEPREPDDNTIRLWEVQSGQLRGRLVGNQKGTTALAFSPDGRHLVSGSKDGVVRLWDVSSGTWRELRGHAGAVLGVAFAPDGRTLASAGADTTALIWDVRAALARPLRRP
ncbi:MAG: PQQ-binding-like beta-propeller repeat protein [Gemmataceae bacterium]|nr:PQQ-binding-like beta-propeller repeat protein [Gemmataceae bacterium]